MYTAISGLWHYAVEPIHERVTSRSDKPSSGGLLADSRNCLSLLHRFFLQFRLDIHGRPRQHSLLHVIGRVTVRERTSSRPLLSCY
jgi:hypothetical protein